jgi:hypothetical protein
MHNAKDQTENSERRAHDQNAAEEREEAQHETGDGQTGSWPLCWLSDGRWLRILVHNN